MTSVVSRLLEFVDERLDHMLEAPEMWGSGESVELQILQLLEIRALILEPAPEARWRSVQADYETFLAARFPGTPPTTLSARLGDRQDELTAVLGQFVATQRDAHRHSRSHRNAEEIRIIEHLLELGRFAARREADRHETNGDRAIKLVEPPRS